jgi:hypothetical protein
MKADHIEYCISGSSQNTWHIFRQDSQIGIRRSIFDAVDFATRIAEREAMLSYASTKVTIEMPFEATRLPEKRKQTNDAGEQQMGTDCLAWASYRE